MGQQRDSADHMLGNQLERGSISTRVSMAIEARYGNTEIRVVAPKVSARSGTCHFHGGIGSKPGLEFSFSLLFQVGSWKDFFKSSLAHPLDSVDLS